MTMASLGRKGFFVVHAGNEAMNHFAAKRTGARDKPTEPVDLSRKRISRPLG